MHVSYIAPACMHTFGIFYQYAWPKNLAVLMKMLFVHRSLNHLFTTDVEMELRDSFLKFFLLLYFFVLKKSRLSVLRTLGTQVSNTRKTTSLTRTEEFILP